MQVPPNHNGKGSPVGPSFVRTAAIFYGLLAVAGALWIGLRDLDVRFWGDEPLSGLAFGAVSAAATILSGLLAYRALPVLRKVSGELAPRFVDPAGRVDLVLVSVFSGVGEEVFFRGAVQGEFGIVVSSLAFGLAHVGPDRRYLLWTVWAVAAGFLFGGLYALTGGLLAPVVAHAAHNAVTLLLWKRSRPRPGPHQGAP